MFAKITSVFRHALSDQEDIVQIEILPRLIMPTVMSSAATEIRIMGRDAFIFDRNASLGVIKV
jgi:hypothetical protein